jgi:hypothetical protein
MPSRGGRHLLHYPVRSRPTTRTWQHRSCCRRRRQADRPLAKSRQPEPYRAWSQPSTHAYGTCRGTLVRLVHLCAVSRRQSLQAVACLKGMLTWWRPWIPAVAKTSVTASSSDHQPTYSKHLDTRFRERESGLSHQLKATSHRLSLCRTNAYGQDSQWLLVA